jgi:hypothetical protein
LAYPGGHPHDKADTAFAVLKKVLSVPTLLAAPEAKEPMLMYIAATNCVISIIMVTERPEEGREYPIQRPMYYLSEVLTETKQWYPQYQKLVYAIFRATRWLPHYFQQHKISIF